MKLNKLLERSFIKTKDGQVDITIYIDPSWFKVKSVLPSFRLNEGRFLVYDNTMFLFAAGLGTHLTILNVLEKQEGYSFNMGIPYAMGFVTPQNQEPTPSEWKYSSTNLQGRYRFEGLDFAFYTGSDSGWDRFKTETQQRLCKQILSNGVDISGSAKGV